MADYYPLLAKAITGLKTSTPEARTAIYDRARKALLGQLRAMQPPAPEAAIEREAKALEDAIARLELDQATAEAEPAFASEEERRSRGRPCRKQRSTPTNLPPKPGIEARPQARRRNPTKAWPSAVAAEGEERLAGRGVRRIARSPASRRAQAEAEPRRGPAPVRHHRRRSCRRGRLGGLRRLEAARPARRSRQAGPGAGDLRPEVRRQDRRAGRRGQRLSAAPGPDQSGARRRAERSDRLSGGDPAAGALRAGRRENLCRDRGLAARHAPIAAPTSNCRARCAPTWTFPKPASRPR